LRANSGILDAGSVELERESTFGRVCDRINVVRKRAKAGRRVEGAEGVVKERVSTDSSVALSFGVEEKCERSSGSVPGTQSIT
jgi:hypothetical protein